MKLQVWKILTIVAALLAPAGAAAADERSFGASYMFSMYGLTIGKADFVGTIGDGKYRIDGHVSSAGLANVFAKALGEVSAHGRVSGTRMRPTSFLLDYLYDEKRRRTRIAFSGNRASETVVTPAPEGRRASWIPVADRHLENVIDPISAAILIAESPEKVCDRTLKLYDGELRANLVLTPSTLTEEGGAVCAVRFEPIAGYHPENRSITYLREASRIVFSYAPLGNNAYGLSAASVGTQIGTIRLTLRRLDLL